MLMKIFYLTISFKERKRGEPLTWKQLLSMLMYFLSSEKSLFYFMQISAGSNAEMQSYFLRKEMENYPILWCT